MRNKNSGQNLIEFALVAPILILVLVVISELGYAFVLKHTIIDGIKQSVLSANYNVGKFSTQADLLGQMKSDFENFRNTHNLPEPVSLKYGLISSNSFGTVIGVEYTYKPGFRLTGITPEKITVKSVQVVQPGLLKINNPNLSIVKKIDVI